MLKRILLFLALGLPVVADDQPIIDFPALVAQADRHQLPKPPREAKLNRPDLS